MTTLIQLLPNEDATLALAAKLAPLCLPPLAIYLEGQLGAGKTTFVRGFLRGLEYAGKVKSPSYNIVESYELGNKSIFHFDFYRIQDPAELDFIGLQDYWQSSALFLIEWPDKGGDLLPPADLICGLELEGEGRRFRLEGKSEAGERIVQDLKDLLA